MRRRRVLAGIGSALAVPLSGCSLPPGVTWVADCPSYDGRADRTVCSRTAPRPDLFLAAEAVVYDYEPGPVPTEARFRTVLKNRTDAAVTVQGADATVHAERADWAAVPTTAAGTDVTLASGDDLAVSVRDAALSRGTAGESGDAVDVAAEFGGTGDYALVVPVGVGGETVAVSLRFRFRD